jgi:hypothetical protein
MAIQSLYPAIKPSLNLDFANTKTLDPRIGFTRASTATFYDGKTFAKAEENLLLQSQEFEDASWTKTNVTVTANTQVAPDGTTTAELLTDNSTSGVHRVEVLATSVTGTWVFSVFAKAGTATWLHLRNNAVGHGVWFNLTNGVLGTQTSGYVGTITSVGNGWYRCSMVSSAAIALSLGISIANADNNAVYVGSGSTLEIWGAQLEQRSTVTAYTPTTTQPITNYIPVLQTAAANVARFDHNPVTGESLGLLIEEQRANLVLQSEDFTTTWAATRATVGANSVVAPTGALTADRLIDNTDNNTHFVSQNVTTSAVAMTFSVFAKASGRSFVYLSINDSGNVARTTFFNLSTGAVGTTGTGITASIVPVGNGWYRCIVTVAAAFAGTNPCVIGVASADNTASYAGNGFDGVAIWGAQVE